MMVDGVIVPVLDPATQWTGEGHSDQLDSCFRKPSGHRTLLAPGVAPVAVAEAGIFQIKVEGAARFGAGHHSPSLLLKDVKGARSGTIQRTVQVIELLPQAHATVDARDLLTVA